MQQVCGVLPVTQELRGADARTTQSQSEPAFRAGNQPQDTGNPWTWDKECHEGWDHLGSFGIIWDHGSAGIHCGQPLAESAVSGPAMPSEQPAQWQADLSCTKALLPVRTDGLGYRNSPDFQEKRNSRSYDRRHRC